MARPQRHIPTDMIAHYIRATRLSEGGHHEEAMEAWDRLLIGDPGADPLDEGPLAGHILALTLIRRSHSLIALGRLREAKACLEGPALVGCMAMLNIRELAEYWLTYGDLLGFEGDMDGMHEATERALFIALFELEDLWMCESIWKRRFEHGWRNRHWEYVEEQAQDLIALAMETGDANLAMMGSDHHGRASRELERYLTLH